MKIILSDLASLAAEKQKQEEAARIVESSDQIVGGYKDLIRQLDGDIIKLTAENKSLKAQLEGRESKPADGGLTEAAEKVERLQAENEQLKKDLKV